MSLINLKNLLTVADARRFAVGAFNAIDSNFIDAVFAAAARERSPVIINMAEVHLPYIDMEASAAYIRAKADKAGVPVCLNLDHGLTVATVERAIAAGFTSVMFDGSHLSYADNLAQTKAVVELCRPHNISVEGELGAVGGDEGGALESEADEALYTDVAQAREFVEETGIDALAVAIGNTHGKYKGAPKLDFARLSAIEEAVREPLVLHGGSGLSEEDFRRAVSLGICKINFFTGMSQAAMHSLQHASQSPDAASKYNYYLMMMAKMQQAVADTVCEQMRIFGSSGQAEHYRDISHV